MRCSKCDSDNRGGRKFCANCGAPLIVTCPKCGAINQPAEKFCGECGAGLTAADGPKVSNRARLSPFGRSDGPSERLVRLLFANVPQRGRVIVNAAPDPLATAP